MQIKCEQFMVILKKLKINTSTSIRIVEHIEY